MRTFVQRIRFAHWNSQTFSQKFREALRIKLNFRSREQCKETYECEHRGSKGRCCYVPVSQMYQLVRADCEQTSHTQSVSTVNLAGRDDVIEMIASRAPSVWNPGSIDLCQWWTDVSNSRGNWLDRYWFLVYARRLVFSLALKYSFEKASIRPDCHSLARVVRPWKINEQHVTTRHFAGASFARELGNGPTWTWDNKNRHNTNIAGCFRLFELVRRDCFRVSINVTGDVLDVLNEPMM